MNYPSSKEQIECALESEFPHPSIIEDLYLIPAPGFLPRWLDLYDADEDTRKAGLAVLESGGGWEEIRAAIEPYATDDDGKYSDFYRQIVFRALGTQSKFISQNSRLTLLNSLASAKIFLSEYAFQPGHKTAIFKIFESAGNSQLFEVWLTCHLNISFCEHILHFPANPNISLDRVVKMCKPLIGKHPLEPRPKKFNSEEFKKLSNERRVAYSHRFRLYDTWEWIEYEVRAKVDPTGTRFLGANLPFKTRHSSDKKATTAAKKIIKAEASKFGVSPESVDTKPESLIVAQCLYCYEFRVESALGGNGVVSRYCPHCAGLDREFWKIWKK